MAIENVLASVAVKDVKAAAGWYTQLLGQPASMPMSELAEWTFPRGGGLQAYQAAERAGKGSCTMAVNDLEQQLRHLESMGVDTSDRSSDPRVKTVMITDPDGNHLAFAQALDPVLAR